MNSRLDPNRINFLEMNGSWAMVFRMSDDLYDYMWKRYEQGDKDNKDYRGELAGNISRSFGLTDPDNRIIGELLQYVATSEYSELIRDRIKDILRMTELSNVVNTPLNFAINPYLCSLWANNQYKYEFNPPHDHAGILSFVMWMKIPYEYNNEKELPFVKGSNSTAPVGNFSFHYIHNSSCAEKIIEMDPGMNGWCALFPSTLKHSVYPFYTSDEARISISGNLSFRIIDTDLLPKKDPTHKNTSHS